MTAKQHLEAARTSATWGVHAPALEAWLAETRPGFMDQNFHSMSDMLLCFHWIHAPGGFDLWERIFAEQHEKDNREWWAYRLEKVL